MMSGTQNSGKSMFLQNIGIRRARRGFHVHSIESPIERMVQGIFQYEVTENMDWSAWSTFITRNDPGDIILGEINSARTARELLGFANGKLVMSTIHTSRAIRFAERLRNLISSGSSDSGEKSSLMASFVSVMGWVYCQKLLPRVCPHCSKVEAVPQKVIENFGWHGMKWWREPGKGCDKGSCRSEGPARGYTTDRVPLTESLYVPAMASSFLESGVTAYDLLARAEKLQTQTYRRSARYMLDADRSHGGLTTWDRIRPNIQEDMYSLRRMDQRLIAV
jgi:type II secretory ATPase GspE/PulE/Tfp pilus assembly ATPase PilB-like protein